MIFIKNFITLTILVSAFWVMIDSASLSDEDLKKKCNEVITAATNYEEYEIKSGDNSSDYDSADWSRTTLSGVSEEFKISLTDEELLGLIKLFSKFLDDTRHIKKHTNPLSSFCSSDDLQSNVIWNKLKSQK